MILFIPEQFLYIYKKISANCLNSMFLDFVFSNLMSLLFCIKTYMQSKLDTIYGKIGFYGAQDESMNNR